MQKRLAAMSVVVLERQEEKFRFIWRGKVDGIPLVITAKAYLMAPIPSIAEEQMTKKRHVHNIGCGITIESTASQLYYQARDCSGRSGQWK